jgi:hypothetical protein
MFRKLAIAVPGLMAVAAPVVLTIANVTPHVAQVAGLRGP